MDQKAIEAAGFDKGLVQGLEQGLEQGIEQGIERGEKNKTIELAKKMKAQGFDFDTIHNLTDLSVREIEKL